MTLTVDSIYLFQFFINKQQSNSPVVEGIMKFGSKLFTSICIIALAVAIYGCGGDGNSQGPTGKVVKGPVVNATIFADNVSGTGRFALDAGEISTTTDPVTGDFTLPSVPGYNYILVSKGGTDKITGQPAIQMIAPAGAANVTPFTTLVALAGDVTNYNKLKTELTKLLPAGVGYDADISAEASTSIAALLVAKSVESLVQIMTNAITTAAGAGNISATQIAEVQAQIMQEIAKRFAADGPIPKNTVGLTTSLQTAATAAVAAFDANIAIPAGVATTIASDAVTLTNTALGSPADFATTTLTGGETSLTGLSGVATAVASAVTTATTAIPPGSVTSTPIAYTPPLITVVTPITVIGITGTTGGSSIGTGTGF